MSEKVIESKRTKSKERIDVSFKQFERIVYWFSYLPKTWSKAEINRNWMKCFCLHRRRYFHHGAILKLARCNEFHTNDVKPVKIEF